MCFYFYFFVSSTFFPLNLCHQVPIEILLLYFYLLSIKAIKSPFFHLLCRRIKKKRKEDKWMLHKWSQGGREVGDRGPVLLARKNGKV